jgi:hypothetical protein
MAQSSACDTRYPPQLHRLVGRNYTPRSAGNSVNRTRRAMGRQYLAGGSTVYSNSAFFFVTCAPVLSENRVLIGLSSVSLLGRVINLCNVAQGSVGVKRLRPTFHFLRLRACRASAPQDGIAPLPHGCCTTGLFAEGLWAAQFAQGVERAVFTYRHGFRQQINHEIW